MPEFLAEYFTNTWALLGNSCAQAISVFMRTSLLFIRSSFGKRPCLLARTPFHKSIVPRRHKPDNFHFSRVFLLDNIHKLELSQLNKVKRTVKRIMITLLCCFIFLVSSESCSERSLIDWSKVGTSSSEASDNLVLAELKCSNLFLERSFNWNGFYNHYKTNYLDDDIFQKGINWFDRSERTYLNLDSYESYLFKSFIHPIATLVLVSDEKSHFLNFTYKSKSIHCQLDEEAIQCQHCGAAPRQTLNFNQFRTRHLTFLAQSTDHKSAQIGLAYKNPLIDSTLIPSDHLWSVQVLIRKCDLTLKVKHLR